MVARLAPPAHQIVPLEDRANGTDGRQTDLAVAAADLLADLWGSPGRVLLLELQNQRLDLKG
jgi:hypothetical protein